jgi:hypothetical protein
MSGVAVFIVTITVPDLPVSTVEVARIVKDASLSSALTVNTPPSLITVFS